ncbi:bifunctional histidinol-phosphatase/imidazoleglycerol-phosphate dehydratase HisB [Blattabacterium cuenoti]|uniref:bifunctional histidinol-phosphatase/imidazoleglycerol-phosphate dehydratase HisB n=1 Tax=Blattabacterium cuenoti TaxID=1653831 RepID=UPI00163BFEE5|nr:bifunctional histidinol-phosphatase/imidazoleglycerol-phosphate dehydratase HisB [Blattabacterium cuenoti]
MNKKKILFLDRDGTILQEPSINYQIDNIKKMLFYPQVIYFLSKIISQFNYQLVMVTNQDGLGTDKFPEKNFFIIQNHLLKILETEGIQFFAIHIDRSFPEDNVRTRKPGVGMLLDYFNKTYYNLSESFVIGDRITDVLLAKNLGCKAIWINQQNHFSYTNIIKLNKINLDELQNVISLKTDNWKEIYEFLSYNTNIYNKQFQYTRITYETDIKININLYGNGQAKINTKLGFLNHLLEQMSFHSNIDIDLYAKGDINVDEHHTIEDIAIALGESINKKLINKIGIDRYGFFSIPMDDSISTVVLDLGGRSHLCWKVKFVREKIGQISTEMFFHFFNSFSYSAKCNIYIFSKGKNEHHKIESIFKAFAKALKMAINRNNSSKIPSTKGLL